MYLVWGGEPGAEVAKEEHHEIRLVKKEGAGSCSAMKNLDIPGRQASTGEWRAGLDTI